MTYLIKATNVYRTPTIAEALNLRNELAAGPGELTSFKYTTKAIKEKGVIVEEYQLVTATIQFNSEKECDDDIRENYGGEF